MATWRTINIKDGTAYIVRCKLTETAELPLTEKEIVINNLADQIEKLEKEIRTTYRLKDSR